MSTKIVTLRDECAWKDWIYELLERIWPQEWVWVHAWLRLAESEEQTRRVAWRLSITTQRVVLPS